MLLRHLPLLLGLERIFLGRRNQDVVEGLRDQEEHSKEGIVAEDRHERCTSPLTDQFRLLYCFLNQENPPLFAKLRPRSRRVRTEKSRLVKKWSIPGGNTYVFMALKSHRSVEAMGVVISHEYRLMLSLQSRISRKKTSSTRDGMRGVFINHARGST
ncbi:hypothetical protein VNO77_31567 [Canavalia gladiata]|uniref:Uncharacterized protein n=1 Tax=Canavalia gladiata TaxID=3824 RepID=A0AAN9KR33_CANGL